MLLEIMITLYVLDVVDGREYDTMRTSERMRGLRFEHITGKTQ